jgi:hypothetical protein
MELLVSALALSISLAFAQQNDNELNLGKSMPGLMPASLIPTAQ